MLAAYLLHWGAWALVEEASQVVMSVLTKTVNWFAEYVLSGFAVVEEAAVSVRLLPHQMAYVIVPIILGLLLGWWALRRKRKTLPRSL